MVIELTPCEIKSVNYTAVGKLTARGLTVQDAQNYIYKALVVFEQARGNKLCYYSTRGGHSSK
ncbi:MAG: hypothetical protein FD169_1139 [Bacillota bacterium]|nr:MAG: hypothetical protein FD169_1139 [Bacillota bacterium]